MSKLKILVIGDSLAGNYGLSGTQSWTEILRDRYPLKFSFFFHNGFSSTDILNVFYEDLGSTKYDKVFFLCGTNDILRSLKPANTVSTTLFMCSTVMDKGMKAEVIMPPLYEVSDFENFAGENSVIYNRQLSNLRALMSLCCEDRNIPVYDLSDAVSSFLENNGSAFLDGIHFNSDFHSYLADRFEKDHSSLFE